MPQHIVIEIESFFGELLQREHLLDGFDCNVSFAVATQSEQGHFVIIDDGYTSLSEVYDAWPHLKPPTEL